MTENLRFVGQRLKVYMQIRGLTLTGVARMSQFSIKELDGMIDGEYYPVSRLMVLLALFDDLNPNWLLSGQEPMLLRGAIPVKRELVDDIAARETLRRHGIIPLKADPGLGQRVAALEIELTELRALVADLAARRSRKKAQ
ncbi:MAG: helix-turn-helix transcriptional regulator [Hymenobacteraceae bacterium]|nr:helix-turn-helix transcriptional regulator [Hymenobacteraceae bacterium]